jgi:RNA polymerase sigma-70 factor, ECF subfamily
MNGASREQLAGEDAFAESLLKRIAQRDAGAMEQLFSLYQDAVYRLAMVRIETPAAAGQLLHELMVQLWSGAIVPPPGERPRTWLLGLVVRAADVPSELPVEPALDPSSEMLAAAPDPSRSSENLHTVLRRLPERYRTAVHLAYFEHLSDTEIARVLDRSEAAVAWDRRQGRDALAAMQQLRGGVDERGRELFLDSWMRRELRMAPDPSPGDFGLDRLRVAMRQIDRERRRGGFSRLLRRFGFGATPPQVSPAG